MLQQIDQIAAPTAARIHHAHAWLDPPAQDLIEQVDVDIAELIAQH
jgi:hypothetical protein